MLIHVDGLLFPEDFTMVNIKGDTRGPVILGLPFLEIEKTLIDVETGELFLKFNKEKWCLMCMDGHRM